MSKKLKEKSKNTQKDSTFNVDNEIIIGIKTLPNPEENKKKTQKRKNEKIKNKKEKVVVEKPKKSDEVLLLEEIRDLLKKETSEKEEKV